MMGQQPPSQHPLFITGFSLEKRIRREHPLRKIAEIVDFDFIYEEVADKYGKKGNVSIPPPGNPETDASVVFLQRAL